MMIPKSFKNIENKKLLLFQSIPKTGGRFIHRTLTDDESICYICLDHSYAMDDPVKTVYQGFKQFGSVDDRSDYFLTRQPDSWKAAVDLRNQAVAYQKYIQNDQQLQFSVIRNPFSLLYSIFRYNWSQVKPSINALLCAKSNIKRHGGDADAGLISLSYNLTHSDFSNFIKSWFSDDAQNLIPYFGKFLYFQLFKSSGECYTPYVLRTEKLVAGMECLYGAVGEKPPSTLYRRLDSTKAGGGKMNDSEAYKSAYTDETIDIVMKKCHRELQAFGYDFDGPTDERVIIDTSNIFYYPENDEFEIKDNTVEYESIREN